MSTSEKLLSTMHSRGGVIRLQLLVREDMINLKTSIAECMNPSTRCGSEKQGRAWIRDEDGIFFQFPRDSDEKMSSRKWEDETKLWTRSHPPRESRILTWPGAAKATGRKKELWGGEIAGRGGTQRKSRGDARSWRQRAS
ncbi:hypothetical protein AXF42_Ash004226 [Apostasia shenzhenica]|uniref:Uncharacterized protein n=1 Tax=Apostasia shenzhenica TaxID=1088818 RepID=A0A2I0A2B8_9ASPA|nr:hypothetical protein AXF42_Ash004226 [Apostasia shenzhenica]